MQRMIKSKSERLFDVFNILFMVFMVVVTLYPIYHVLMSSLSNSNQLLGHTGLLFQPLDFTLGAYRMVFKNPNILSGYQITLFVVVFGTFINLLLTAMGAYALSRKNVFWTRSVMLGIVFTMFFSGGLIPMYLLVNNWLHLGNSLLALIFPAAVSTWNLIIMRTSFGSIPDGLIESAKIDGAQDFTILFRIVIPISMPVIAVMILFYGVQHWNSWFPAMIYLRDRELYPLQLILREILIQNSTDSLLSDASNDDVEAIGESIKFATIMVATLPILFVYPFLQKYFVKGVMIGSIKG